METQTLVKPKIITKTVREVWEALDHNGYDHLRGAWFDDTKKGACVLGQAALNLGVFSSYDNFNDVVAFHTEEYIDEFYKTYQDYAVDKQLNQFLVSPDSPWRREGYGCGATIIYWNDKQAEGRDVLDFALPTYEDVSKMAKEVLEPYFDETVELVSFDY